jgi:hypothetical protein
MDDFPWRGALALTIGAAFVLWGLLRWLERDDDAAIDDDSYLDAESRGTGGDHG